MMGILRQPIAGAALRALAFAANGVLSVAKSARVGPKRVARSLSVAVLLGLASMAPALAQFQFCPTFDSCAAGLLSVVDASGKVGAVISDDNHRTATNSAVTATVGTCNNVICGDLGPYAAAAAQTDFGVNRAKGYTGPASPRGVPAVLTQATASSYWQDVLSFSGNGSAHADVSFDGTTGIGYPSSTSYSSWNYSVSVFDLSDLVPDGDFLSPRVVAQASTGTTLLGPPYAGTLALDFDYVAGDSYFINSFLGAVASDGAYADFYNTVRLGSLHLSDGTSMQSLSGHDYLATVSPVPEPEVWASMLAGGLTLLGMSRRRRRSVR